LRNGIMNDLIGFVLQLQRHNGLAAPKPIAPPKK